MFGGPFPSAGVARVINGVTYRYNHVAFAHWVNLTTNHNYYEIRRNRRLVAKVRTEAEINAFFDKVAAETAPALT